MNLSTEYLKDLLKRTFPGPWEYNHFIVRTPSGKSAAEDHTHRIRSKYGTVCEQTGDEANSDDDSNFELAALAPTLAVEVLKLRGIIEDCEKSIAAANQAPEQATRPEDVPTGEAWLVNVTDGKASGERVVALKYGRNHWITGIGAVKCGYTWVDSEVSLIAPLAPVTPTVTTPEHPEYLETPEDYEDAPVGTVLERQRDAFGGRHLVKLDKVVHQSWYIPGIPGEFRDENLAGTRRRVLYWPAQEEVVE